MMENLPMFWAQGGELVDAGGKPVFGEGKNRVAMLNVLEFPQAHHRLPVPVRAGS